MFSVVDDVALALVWLRFVSFAVVVVPLLFPYVDVFIICVVRAAGVVGAVAVAVGVVVSIVVGVPGVVNVAGVVVCGLSFGGNCVLSVGGSC